MIDPEDVLRNDLQLIDSALYPSSAPVEDVLNRGRRIRRRRRQIRALAGAAAVAVLIAVIPWADVVNRHPAPLPPTGVREVRQIDPVQAAGQLKTTDPDVRGTAAQAWQWTDDQGTNLLLTTRTPAENINGVMYNGILRAYLATGLDTDHPRVRRVVEQDNNHGIEGAGAPCDLDGGIDFVDSPTVITDSDRDGVAEVSLGWWQMCRSDGGAANVHLATITEQGIYTLAGEGSPRRPRPAEGKAKIFPSTGTAGVPPVDPVADPAPASWPTGIHQAATALFRSLYR